MGGYSTMEDMQITQRHSYTAEPDAVVAMMADEIWLAEVARRAGAERWDVSSDAFASHVHAVLPAPEQARRFTGPTLKVQLEIRWLQAQLDGSRAGRLQVQIPGMPASMGGSALMTSVSIAGQLGTLIHYEAEFTIRVPLVGRSLESAAAPYVRRVIDTQQEVGNDYLAGRLG